MSDRQLPRKIAGKKPFAGVRQVRLGSLVSEHPLAICIACGALAALLVVVYATQVNRQATEARAAMLAKYGGEQVEVCVATRDIAQGETIDGTCVMARLWVADLLPVGALRSVSQVVGRVATSSILAGEVFVEGRFVVGADSLEVPEGLTAVSVPAKDVQAVGGAIEPGMRIDIYATGGSTTTLIGSEVLVLATSKQPTGKTQATGAQSVQWITVALRPDRVEETVAAAQNMSLYFSLPGEGVGEVLAALEAELATQGDNHTETVNSGLGESVDRLTAQDGMSDATNVSKTVDTASVGAEQEGAR